MGIGIYISLCWKESQPKFHAPIKWGTKLAIKRKKREEEECKKKNEIDSQKSPKLLYTDTPKTEEVAESPLHLRSQEGPAVGINSLRSNPTS